MIDKALLLFLPAFTAGISMSMLRMPATFLRLLLAFSGAFLLSVTLTHVLPEVFEAEHHWAGLWLLIGFCLQIVIDMFSKGLEHGHVHLHHHEGHHHHHGPAKAAIPMVSLGLFVHGLLEGLPLFSVKSIEDPLLWGIVLHSIPVAAVYAGLLRKHALGLWKRWFLIAAFCLMAPLGMALGAWQTEGHEQLKTVFMGLTAGVFLHISTTILFESAHEHQYKLRRLLAILAGMAAGALGIWFGHAHA